MFIWSIFSLAAFANTLLAEPINRVGRNAYPRDTLEITEADVDRMHLYSQYSAATYCNANALDGAPIACDDNCSRVLADKGIILKSFQTPSDTDIAGYMALVPNRKQIIFAARGTYSDINWETNLDFWVSETNLVKGGLFHRGFYNAWALLAKNVTTAIDEAQASYPDYSLVAVGHSLGGAIAAVGAAHLRAAGYKLDLYTYGQPRIGNDKISDFVTNQPGRVYRVTHGADPVPRLPPALVGYRHISPEVWLKGNQTDAQHWPLSEIKVCGGNNNKGCNANSSIKFNAVDHGLYFGKMTCSLKGSTKSPSSITN